MEKQEETKKRLRKIAQTETWIALINVLAVAAAFSFFKSLQTPAFFAVFSLYSWFWYLQGKEENKIDEYDVPEPSDGLRKMFKSWLYALLVLYLLWYCSPTRT